MASNKKSISVYDIVLIGMMAALVFVGTYLHIDVMTPMGKVMIHFGNVFCLLSGMLLGGVRGGLAAGIGSMLYDLLDPAYISECWITFLNKFVMAFLCGIIVSCGVKMIAKLQQNLENGSLSQKASTANHKLLSGIGLSLMAALAVLVGLQGYRSVAAFSGEDAFAGAVRIAACVLLCAVLIIGVVIGVKKLFSKAAAADPVDARAQRITFVTRITGGIMGIVGYLVLYLGKTFLMGLIQKQEMATIYTTLLTKGAVSLINGIIAVAVSMLLIPYFVMALKSTGLARKLAKGR